MAELLKSLQRLFTSLENCRLFVYKLRNRAYCDWVVLSNSVVVWGIGLGCVLPVGRGRDAGKGGEILDRGRTESLVQE
ncbi:hypothetical protein HY991_05125 [Candidatus Micrarchaeota archaeon]|nr:hypothetical protein [Candidatus Micrarchaeota archaeon]